jgi:hypothetical protein
VTHDAPAEPTYAVVEPVGRERLVPLTVAPGLSDLAGTRIGFVWDSRFDGRMGSVGHELSGDNHGHAAKQVLEELPARMSPSASDAIVAGIGA